ncbi:phosphatase PAP2 family protein [Lactobacillus kefiranofaciens]|uniref:Phosphatase PAP2 family protein n=2 Tax=Lactobacillus kefiranofaciens TaxID=267818 RepID=A0AAX3UGG6_9LACO|nr:phosphatase PAP2 family protein [Lactobacillus kefiranofaciens]AEG39858.1 Membrane-associated phospholipid phosphatase [Lactobacillus kefiranofaciens subsp. kefiranofaciens]MCJ2172789.1 phosphatase PAP2 family protein [Lactobacillus kefiranofaciens]MCP9331305.1 phosphatase PAP2 family protein [Lactobacillus kefiranofaciens]MDF4141600.1 phosphatase PAP2 family protein [Lactobacillus kefiranofaciens]MDH5100880.1 phosphatase PAP2 family protein [Lactobacillus kefiranofaciens]
MINTENPPRGSLVPASIFVVIYAVWALLVSSGSHIITMFDNAVVGIICNNNPANVAFATLFTNLGNTSVITIETIILFIILITFRQYAYAWFTAGVMICANGYNWIIKHAVERRRPTIHHLVYADGYSFPSGHSVGSAALFGILIVLTILLIRSKFWKSLLIIIWALFPILIGYTRIFVHVHYPSDVLGGWIEGITFVLLGYAFLYRYYIEPKMLERHQE